MRRLLITCGITMIALCALVSCSSKSIPKEIGLEQPDTDWPEYRKDATAIGSDPSSRFTGKLDVIWERRIGGKPCGPLTFAGGQLIYPDSRRKLHFFSLADGDKTASYKTSGPPQTGAMVSDKLVVYADGVPKNKVRAVRISNSKEVWRAEVKDATAGSILVKNSVILSSGDGVLTSFNLSDGKQNWTYKVKARYTAPPVFQNATIFQPADDRRIYAVDIETGKERFSTETDAVVVSNAVAVGDIFCADIEGKLYRIDAATGAIEWKRETEETFWSAPSYAEGNLYVAASSGSIISLDAETGSINWECHVIEVCKSSPVVAGDVVVAGTMTGRLLTLEAATGKLIAQRQLSGGISVAPVVDEAHIYVATDKGYIHCFGEKNENVAADH